jgi:hypothetical protein
MFRTQSTITSEHKPTLKDRLPNELRIDAAERDKVKGRRARAAASIRVERSRTPEDTILLGIKAKGQAGKTGPSYLLRQAMRELYMQRRCFCRGKKS